ncbi:hypothetical protein CK203_093951 [Vitis vinifera]|uniref:Uncharacterized protein n=1 Tax=Vitis vinifera TaxID=29760 RepID=A0A438CKB2_VITVI|nr:hypothetical protein CK203_093951 [Vitis vinifera]
MTVTPLEWVLGRDRVIFRDFAGLVERQARATGSNGQGQSSSTRGSSFDEFKKLGPPYFSGTSDPTEAKAWIMKIEKFFDVIDCFRSKKPLMQHLLFDEKGGRVCRLEQGNLTWPKVVDRALIAEKDNEELHQYREQQRKRNRNDGAHGNQAQKSLLQVEIRIKENTKFRWDLSYLWQKHGGGHAIRDRACFGCGKQGTYGSGLSKEEMTVDLVLLDLQDFDVILGMDWLASYHASIDCFGKRVTFSIPSQPDFSFEGKHVDKPLRMISSL